ncbi:unnamed protein product [Phaedon cochleariae]|uniref:Uncharacterized protein n=1 Tax=Phaedon cochleariae TaxID=80249 RepID=A0A9N9X4B7_PHACE|nr:unnamed protein product [Phaedon cochleariae]
MPLTGPLIRHLHNYHHNNNYNIIWASVWAVWSSASWSALSSKVFIVFVLVVILLFGYYYAEIMADGSASDNTSISTFLKECGANPAILANFEQNGITDLELLNEVSQSEGDFRQLVPCMGTRLKIKLKLRNSLEEIILPFEDDIISEGTVQENTNRIVPIGQSTPGSNAWETTSSSISHIDCEEPPNKYIILEHIDLPKAQPKKNQAVLEPDVDKPQEIELPHLLEQTIVGRAIKSIYKLKKQLDSRCQAYLADIIIQHYVNIRPFRRLQNSDFNKISQDIAKLFPNEVPGVYYTAPIKKRNSRNNKSIVARGKLIDKYRNKLSFLRKASALPTRLFDETDTDDSSHFADDVQIDFEDDVTWLKNSRAPWAEVQEKWSNTFPFRQALLSKEVGIQEILDEFSIIKDPLGYTLVDSDFKLRYPGNYRKIYTKFESVFNSLLETRRKHLTPADNLILDIIQSPDVNQESKTVLMLNILISLLPTKSFNKKSKTNWHPTVNESKEGIFVQIKNAGDLENVVEGKRATMKKYGLPMLPFVIVESPTYTEIKNIYVSFDRTVYKLISVLKAIDVCFQLIHVLNLVYPFESEHIWMFIQLSMYELKTNFDNIPSILDVVNKIKVGEQTKQN